MAHPPDSTGILRVPVTLESCSYDVLLGSGLLARSGPLLRALPAARGKRVALVTDTNVAPLHAPAVTASLEEAGYEVRRIVVPAGEGSKSMEQVTAVCREMHQAGLDRGSCVIALGGGVVGDLAGFCAAIFNRGIPYVQMPTTIVSLVDSSVGGKTGVNLPEGKNLLGCFHQPAAVLGDTDTLATLPGRAYREGFAEIIKHGAIRDAAMLEGLERFRDRADGIAPLIRRNVAIKASIVQEDERETTGTRALLNFGHTVGHGIEAAADGALLHGEAVSLGIKAALDLSVSRAGLPPAEADRVLRLLEAFGLPLRLDARFSAERIMEKLERDKKFVDGRIRFVLLRSLGDAFVSADVTRSDLVRAVHGLFVS
jgi:3-dehydroquinate synthase